MSDDYAPPEPDPTPVKVPKEVQVIALLGLIIITGAAVVALAYNAIVHGGSTDGLTTIAAVGAGGLVASFGSTARPK